MGLPRPSGVKFGLHPPCPPNSSASIGNDHFPRDYYELLGPSGVATLERLLTESLESSQADKISRRHLDVGLARLRLELEG